MHGLVKIACSNADAENLKFRKISTPISTFIKTSDKKSVKLIYQSGSERM